MVRTLLCLAALVASVDGFATKSFDTRVATRAAPTSSLTMKLFDWKRREADESAFATLDSGVVFTEDNLKPAPGSKQRKKRKGRGISAGQGASCGFGMRGQKSRSGRPAPPGFEGGQTTLYRRIPKYRGRPTGPGHTHKYFNPIKLEMLNKAADGSTVTFDSLVEAKALTKNMQHPLNKIVGGGDLTAKSLTVQMHAFTSSAKEAIEAAGGTCVVLSPTTGAPVVEE